MNTPGQSGTWGDFHMEGAVAWCPICDWHSIVTQATEGGFFLRECINPECRSFQEDLMPSGVGHFCRIGVWIFSSTSDPRSFQEPKIVSETRILLSHSDIGPMLVKLADDVWDIGPYCGILDRLDDDEGKWESIVPMTIRILRERVK